MSMCVVVVSSSPTAAWDGRCGFYRPGRLRSYRRAPIRGFSSRSSLERVTYSQALPNSGYQYKALKLYFSLTIFAPSQRLLLKSKTKADGISIKVNVAQHQQRNNQIKILLFFSPPAML